MSVRNLQMDKADLFAGTGHQDRRVKINTPYCGGFHVSLEKGQDGLACARCHLIRKHLYESKVDVLASPLEIDIFRLILERYPFIEFVSVYCGQPNEEFQVVYPIGRETNGDPDLIQAKLQEQFVFRKSLGLVDRQILPSQIYYRENYHHVIMPGDSTEKREDFGTKANDGILLETMEVGRRSVPVIRITDFEKAYKDGRFIHIVNYWQAWKLIYHGEMTPIETTQLAKHYAETLKLPELDKAFKEGRHSYVIKYCKEKQLGSTVGFTPISYYELF
jgi:hypothetical protein